ncbi:hypothetical protein [Bradyrhizobium sp. Gha]|uniref:hypothetical protein n=1 Tax=Bradyrhizobium sp. Gha TaxID=1855318 RepID=UPI0008E631E8|nr:hypothetical protein [Bradyrhizobium sp. Gha]SFK18677.1 hypothetical protein SAMN05216525_16025 [Bradyrhizobium sp. Gha]
MTSIYINYYLDRQADPSKQDIEQTRQTFVARLLSALGFTAAIVVFTILVLAYQHVVANIWSMEKTRAVVVGTVTLMTMTLCLVAQFGLRKRRDGSGADGDSALDRQMVGAAPGIVSVEQTG